MEQISISTNILQNCANRIYLLDHAQVIICLVCLICTLGLREVSDEQLLHNFVAKIKKIN